jgi:penicillin-binding protein 2
MFFDWQQFQRSNAVTPAVVDPRRRMLICLVGFAALLLLVFGRIVQLEVSHGAGFRAEAMRPIEKTIVLPAPRGRILARDGTVLAYDRTIHALAVEYRWLQEPPDERWLRNTVRSRLPKSDRKNAAKVAAENAKLLAERGDLAKRLAKLCGLSPEQWNARTRKIQSRIERIAESANLRRPAAVAEAEKADDSWAIRVRRLLLDDPPTPRIVVKEELEPQVVVEDVAPAVVSEISGHGDRYPGTKIVDLTRRTYPKTTLAAHVLGHLGARDEKDPTGQESLPKAPVGQTKAPVGQTFLSAEPVGRMGVEKQYEADLQGRPGTAIEQTDRSGRLVTSYRRAEPVAGRDVELTIDLPLQQTAEQLLNGALQRRAMSSPYSSRSARGTDRNRPPHAEREEYGPEKTPDPFSGAVAVMDVRSGAILAVASAPAFDPNLFAGDDEERLTALLSDPLKPLFDRLSHMAIPPGSAFKTLTAVALLESGAVQPETPFSCRGYLHHPDRQRCEIYVRQHIGHGEVTLAEALAVSCNVYFFHFAGRMGPRPLIDWAERFGFGRPTGIDLPSEAAGTIPCPENIRDLEGHTWRTTDTQSMAVGQSSLAVTPLQMLRMMAAVANGGWLVTPHVARGQGAEVRGQGARDEGRQRVAVTQRTLHAVREGLLRVVADPNGTAHGTVYIKSTAIAGKTGTAETGEDRLSHAWFVGYAPADEPKVAFVVVLEHAGGAATAAGPVAKRLVVRMEQLGIL